MNLLEVYVTNITQHVEEKECGHRITADFNCYGRKEIGVTKIITDADYKMVLEKGYYLG